MQPALRQHLKKSKIQFKVQFATEFLTEKQFSNLKIPFEVQSVTEKQTEFLVVYYSSAAVYFGRYSIVGLSSLRFSFLAVVIVITIPRIGIIMTPPHKRR